MFKAIESLIAYALRVGLIDENDMIYTRNRLLCLLGDDVGRVHLFAAIDGYSAKPPHQDAHGPEEPFLLHQEVAMEVSGTAVEIADDEVPVARVGRKGDDAFVGHRFGDGLLEVEPVEQYLLT